MTAIFMGADRDRLSIISPRPIAARALPLGDDGVQQEPTRRVEWQTAGAAQARQIVLLGKHTYLQ